jgi:molybdenum cofactor biosynthesis protein B
MNALQLAPGGKIDETKPRKSVRVAVLTVSDTRTAADDTSGDLLASRVTGRDVTPEAVRPLFDKEIDGFPIVFHLVSYQTVGLSTLQSRALAGIIKGVFVFCLPGSNGAVKDGWDKVIAAQLDSRHGPCNMVEKMPRLLEK